MLSRIFLLWIDLSDFIAVVKDFLADLHLVCKE
jgi:hypothetical protein